MQRVIVLFVLLLTACGTSAPQGWVSNVDYIGATAGTIIQIDGVQHQLYIDTTKHVTQPEPGLYHTEISLDGVKLVLKARDENLAKHFNVYTEEGRILFEFDTSIERSDRNIHFHLRGKPGVMFASG